MTLRIFVYLFVKCTFTGENVKQVSCYTEVIAHCLDPEQYSSCTTKQIKTQKNHRLPLGGSKGVASETPNSAPLGILFPFMPFINFCQVTIHIHRINISEKHNRTNRKHLTFDTDTRVSRHLKLAAILLTYFTFRTSSCAWLLLEVHSTDIASSRVNLNSTMEKGHESNMNQNIMKLTI